MHQISDETIQRAQVYEQKIAQYAKSSEELGKRIGGSCGKFIKEQGIASQRQIKEGQASLNKL